MSTVLEMSVHFVQPYPQPALNGEHGLTATDIAQSLGSTSRKVRQKLTSLGFLGRIKAQGFQAVPVGTLNESNGLEFMEYVLDVHAAKFLVGKYNSELGDAYLAYLIRLEARVNELNKLAETDPIIRSLMYSVQLREKQLVLEADLADTKKEIKALAQHVSDGAIDEKVTQSLAAKKVGVFPQGCVTAKQAARQFFRGMNPDRTKDYLLAAGHPKQFYQAVVNGTHVTKAVAFVADGLERAADKLFREATAVREQKNGILYFHPQAGNFMLKH